MSDNIQNEINKLIANTDKMQEFWLGVIKNTIAKIEKRLAKAQNENEKGFIYRDLGHCLHEAANEISKYAKFRFAYKEVLEVVEKGAKND